jgi:hypothetical protein
MNARRVQLRLESRRTRVDDEPAVDDLRYLGVTVERLVSDRVVDETWVPCGEEPSCADDEALIAAWHAALRWSWSTTA